MRLSHPDYIKLVIEAYNKKRANNELSPLLAQSTPSKIRQECLNVYKERYDKKDDQILRAFFGPAEHRQFLHLIREFETDRFRPLDNYIKGSTEKTDDRNLELLAWLIDFQHRPYVFDKNFSLSDEEILLIDRSANDLQKKEAGLTPEDESLQKKRAEPGNILKKEPHEEQAENKKEVSILLDTISQNNTGKNKYKRAVIVFLILIVCAGGIYAVWQQKQGKLIMMGNASAGCMYWSEDHYEPVPCNEESKGRLILPLNKEKMKNFKRITKEDTITEKSIGVIYCISIGGGTEYYTTGGNHPVYVTRPLKLLSRYMFERHLRKKEVLVKDSLAE